MPYDRELADRIRAVLGAEPGVDEKRMFGGLAFLVGGHLAVAASGQGDLMVRVAPGDTDALVQRNHVEPMIMAGRVTQGWVRVATDGVTTTRQLRSWISRGVNYARGLPPKK